MYEISPSAEQRWRDGQVRDAERNIAWILQHPAFSDWLKTALRHGLERDPVELANDVELLCHLLRRWTLASMITRRPGSPLRVGEDEQSDRTPTQ